MFQKAGSCGTRFAQTVLAEISQLFETSQARQQGEWCELSYAE